MKNLDFLDILLSQNKIKSHPLKIKNSLVQQSFSRPHPLFSLYEDELEKEVKCPICFGRTGIAARPSGCKHVFCNNCILKWSQTSNKCPVCRGLFTDILLVNIALPEFNFQGDLYVSYD